MVDVQTGQSEFESTCYQFSRTDANCLLSLHPRMVREQYEHLAQKYHVQVADESLRDILPAADLFSASFSTVVQWAVLCHIPTVIIDWYDYVDGFIEKIDGVVLVKQKGRIREVINCLLSDRNQYEKLKNDCKGQAADYSPFDGKCVERIAKIIVDPDILERASKYDQ